EPVIMPFEYDIEVAGIREQQVVNLVPSLEQVSAMMLDGNEAECKAFISFSILAFEPRKARTIVEVKRSPFDMEKRNNMAGMIGYTVKLEDTLWSIAKNYFTTVEKLKELNHLKTDEVSPGEKLLIMK
ncbi:MAG: LysM peptidoglycan-binding domain-containing protein, partial [Lachnospiraceae bacterium]|nr:LysM peptidoglycan-binding domain-containing protein [Lachnospiraceae bacterium]